MDEGVGRAGAQMIRESMMTKQLFGAVAGAALGLAAGSATAADLTVTSWGGSYQDAQREVFFEPFK